MNYTGNSNSRIRVSKPLSRYPGQIECNCAFTGLFIVSATLVHVGAHMVSNHSHINGRLKENFISIHEINYVHVVRPVHLRVTILKFSQKKNLYPLVCEVGDRSTSLAKPCIVKHTENIFNK